MSTSLHPRGLPDIGQVLLFVALVFMFAPIGWVQVHEGELSAPWTAVLVVTLAVLHLSVLAARWRPVSSYAVGCLCMLLLTVAPDLGGPTAVSAGMDYSPLLLPSSLCFLALIYALSAGKSDPWPQIALATGLMGAVLITARLWGFTVTGLAPWAWQLMQVTVVLTGTVAAWALGRFVAVRTAWISELSARGAADERRRIAREMHDVVAHSLAVMVSHAEAGRLVVARQPERAPMILETIAGTGREALNEMRGLLGVLRGSSDETAPAVDPQPGLPDLPALVERIRAAGQRVEFDDSATPPPGSLAVGLTAYRVVQEALTNVIRHATPGSTAHVTVNCDDRNLVVVVSDNGTTAVAAAPGRGLVGMRERVEAVGGEVDAGPAAQGWRVRARLPREGARERG
ncbi:sensor histidine kinase [Nocardioides sp.]|uniref:sensor histidine kinase n=1 Tax=Nocardioides sp. TaxID=35761 RepID=UPI002CEB89D9|nr:sensor histidine kinase [Nocardioides sp.]HXH78852.1 sensor histidine kinase [Nocardioides sp.]